MRNKYHLYCVKVSVKYDEERTSCDIYILIFFSSLLSLQLSSHLFLCLSLFYTLLWMKRWHTHTHKHTIKHTQIKTKIQKTWQRKDFRPFEWGCSETWHPSCHPDWQTNVPVTCWTKFVPSLPPSLSIPSLFSTLPSSSSFPHFFSLIPWFQSLILVFIPSISFYFLFFSPFPHTLSLTVLCSYLLALPPLPHILYFYPDPLFSSTHHPSLIPYLSHLLSTLCPFYFALPPFPSCHLPSNPSLGPW